MAVIRNGRRVQGNEIIPFLQLIIYTWISGMPIRYTMRGRIIKRITRKTDG
jgi:hypothetical protein